MGKKGTCQQVFIALETLDKIPAQKGGVSAVRAGAKELFKIVPKTIQETNKLGGSLGEAFHFQKH